MLLMALMALTAGLEGRVIAMVPAAKFKGNSNRPFDQVLPIMSVKADFLKGELRRWEPRTNR
jgi:hypothetical protein